MQERKDILPLSAAPGSIYWALEFISPFNIPVKRDQNCGMKVEMGLWPECDCCHVKPKLLIQTNRCNIDEASHANSNKMINKDRDSHEIPWLYIRRTNYMTYESCFVMNVWYPLKKHMIISQLPRQDKKSPSPKTSSEKTDWSFIEIWLFFPLSLKWFKWNAFFYELGQFVMFVFH